MPTVGCAAFPGMEKAGDAGCAVLERIGADDPSAAAQSDLRTPRSAAPYRAQACQRSIGEQLDLPSAATRRHTGSAWCAAAWNQDERFSLLPTTPASAGRAVRSDHGCSFAAAGHARSPAPELL